MKLLAILTAFIFCTAQAQKHYPIKNMLGVNAHPWDMVASTADYYNADFETQEKIAAIIDLGVTGIRIYNNVGDCKSDDNTTYRLSPNRIGFPGDSAIMLLKAINPNLKILYCYQGAPKNVQAEYEAYGEGNNVYVHRDADRLNPTSYAELAHDMYVLACRGGNNADVPDYPLWKSQWWYERIQPMYKGAKIYDMLEPGNELDHPGNKRALNGYQYAALWSAVYDSIKKANAGVIISSSGVMTGWPTPLNQAIDWCNANRGGKLPFDEYQFHCYSSGLWDLGVAGAYPPELTGSKQVQAVMDVANKAGIPAYVGEWGYDLSAHSDLGIIPFGGHTPDQIRAWWSARSILDWSKIGLKRMYYFRLYQDYGADADSSHNLFASTSLLCQYGDTLFKRRLVGDMFKQMTAFGDFVFDTALIDNDSVRLYRFTDGRQNLYAGWTIEKVKKVLLWGATRPEFTERVIAVNGIPAGTRYRINEDSSGVFSQSRFAGGWVNLSSNPSFVIEGQTALPAHVIRFTVNKGVDQCVQVRWKVDGADRIDIERSYGGRNFTTYQANVDADGYLSVLWPPPGKIYYRLKMYEADGSYAYSEVRSVVIAGEQLRVRMFNVAGQLIREGYEKDVEGWKPGLKHGIYFLEYSTGNRVLNREKFIKL